MTQNSRSKSRAASDFVRQELGWYVRNCALGPAADLLERFLLKQVDRLKSELESHTTIFDLESDGPVNTRDLNRQRCELRQVLKRYKVIPLACDGVESNAFFARDEFGFDEIDTEILLLLLRSGRNGPLEKFAEGVLRRLHVPARALAALVGIDWQEARRRITTGSALIASGLLSVGERCSSDLVGDCGYLQLAEPLRKIIQCSFSSRQEWVAALLGEPLATPLAWEDFAHLGSIRELAAKIIEGGRNAGSKGVNILLHGPVGTGKTELAKVFAARARMKIWSVGETDEAGDEPSRHDRLSTLNLVQKLLAKREGTLILLDEAEDILSSEKTVFGPFVGYSRSGSKAYVNRFIEQNPVPIIWTCNDVGGIDPAVLRRMSLAIEVKTPSRPVRARIWRRVLNETGLQLGTDAVERLSGRYLVPPAVAANAARAAMLSGEGEAAVEAAMGSVLELLGVGPIVPDADGSNFDPALVNCEDDLARLTERLVHPGASPQWSLCIYGLPGTGKSQFARHLAARLGLEVMQQRASDLLSMWVGGSEKRIASAFQTARTRRAMLVVDEADSLLADRRDAAHSWEVTQVNEMLTWMESHPLPFVCTTNLMDRIDQASLRRFTLKLRFDPLDPARAARAFKSFFGIAAPRGLAEGLTPGDFATVRRKRDLLGVADPSVLADWLDDEAQAKGTRVQPIGFMAGHG